MMMEQYYMYLRKSRKDIDLERGGEGDTLERHEKILMDYARRNHLNVTKIFREVVSGETIAARPEVKKLLSEVETGICAGVLVMEVERLARGDTKDQGIVAEAFKYGNVKIITPMKVYDPNNEFDEEYFEFGLFMSRREYKTINRRLQRGRLMSVQEGKYIGGTAPYGYRKVRVSSGKGNTLEIIPEQADVVRLIYSLYTRGELQEDGSYQPLGMFLICERLDSLRIPPPKSKHWAYATVRDILGNPTYTGKVRWQWRKCVRALQDGQIAMSRRKDKNCMLIDGLHEPIISEETFQAAQKIIQENGRTPVTDNRTLKNPLSGIVKCELCGHTMTRVRNVGKHTYYAMRCPNRVCKNVSAPLDLIEQKVLEALGDWLAGYKLNWDDSSKSVEDDSAIRLKQRAVTACETDLEGLKLQLTNTYNLLEQGIYTTDVFLERNRILTEQINQLTERLETLRDEYEVELLTQQAHKDFIPAIENILELYDTIDSIALKNELLKTVLDRVTYRKDKPNKRGDFDNANFQLTLYPKIPRWK